MPHVIHNMSFPENTSYLLTQVRLEVFAGSYLDTAHRIQLCHPQFDLVLDGMVWYSR
jgi:hypothetical protein